MILIAISEIADINNCLRTFCLSTYAFTKLNPLTKIANIHRFNLYISMLRYSIGNNKIKATPQRMQIHFNPRKSISATHPFYGDLLLVFLFPAVNEFRKDAPHHKKYTSDYGAQENMYDNKRLRHERFEIMVQRPLGRQEDPANHYCHNWGIPLAKEPIQPAAGPLRRQLFCQPFSNQEMKQRPNAGADQSQYQRIHDIPSSEFFFCFRKYLSPRRVYGRVGVRNEDKRTVPRLCLAYQKAYKKYSPKNGTVSTCGMVEKIPGGACAPPGAFYIRQREALSTCPYITIRK